MSLNTVLVRKGWCKDSTTIEAEEKAKKAAELEPKLKSVFETFKTPFEYDMGTFYIPAKLDVKFWINVEFDYYPPKCTLYRGKEKLYTGNPTGAFMAVSYLYKKERKEENDD